MSGQNLHPAPSRYRLVVGVRGENENIKKAELWLPPLGTKSVSIVHAIVCVIRIQGVSIVQVVLWAA